MANSCDVGTVAAVAALAATLFSPYINIHYPFLPAGRALCARPAGPKITLRFLRLYIYICMCVRTYHVRNNYVTYIVAMRPY